MSCQEQPKSHSDCQGFARAYSTYNRYRKTLKRIYRETLDLYTGNSCGVKASEYLDLEHSKLSANEETLVRNTIHNPLSVVVIGQTYKAKCMFVNKLLGQEILPLTSITWLQQCRMTKFKYGTRPQVSISLQDSFVIIEPRLHTSSTSESVDWSQEFKLLEDDLQKTEGGIVEITLYHPFLRGCQVLLCSGNDSMSDVLFEEKYLPQNSTAQCTLGISQLFVYAIENGHFSPHEFQNLSAFRMQYPDCPVAFCLLEQCDYLSEDENRPPLHDNADQACGNSCNACIEERSTDNGGHKMKVREVNRSGVNDSTKILCEGPDICNNKIKRTIREVARNPICESKTPRLAVNNSKINSTNNSTENSLLHGTVSHVSEELMKTLHHIGFQFNHLCTSLDMPHSQHMENDTASLSSSTDEGQYFELCTQTNPSYVSVDTTAIDDLRLKNFPPNCVYLTCQSQGDKLHSKLLSFVRNVAKYYLSRAAKILHRLHSGILNNSIKYAFQMSRDLLITPRRMEYARQQEKQLYSQLVDISTKKQLEIQELISGIKTGLRENILNSAENYNVPDEEGTFRQVSLVKREIQDQVLHHVKTATAERLYNSIQVLKESYVGTLSRCLESLESSVEKDPQREGDGNTSKHFKKILNAAYNVELNIQSSSSLARIMIDKLRQLLSNLPWHEPPIMDRAWCRKVASDVLTSLDDTRLAKSICSQFRTRLSQSHSAFLASLRQLELTHLCRLEHTEENRHRVAKIVAPHIARLALESTSMIDSVLFGMPRMGREIGRGMYGVVYQCDSWSTWSPCAVKSVAPPDEKHANDLSLEFYYTRSLPEHPRIVQIRGSIVDETYAGGMGPPAVLLVMDRMHCDLYTSIKRGLSECERMQVAVDVVEGIRFLHSQGLIHRDIKLKNVLLDRKNRAKITDLGFCKPGAMISGSIVGTPVHMPPELFSGKYNSSVDVYAFGVLFWYLCAGVTRLPRNFETCTTKDHLWTAVRKGVRPERLPTFSDECWYLMKDCWHSDPAKRPLLGKIQLRLIDIHAKIKNSCIS